MLRSAVLGTAAMMLACSTLGCIDRKAELDQVCPSTHGGTLGDSFGDGEDATVTESATESESESESETDTEETETTGMLGLPRLDILFVIDNSGSMGPSQRKLGGAMDAIMEVLEANDVAWRVAFTTTDIGNPLCSTASVENGGLVSNSCLNRPGEFISGATGENVFQVSCEDECAHTDFELEMQNRWLAGGDGTENFNAAIPPVEALRCIAPVGIAGCGFEAPLEAMRNALLRAENPADPNYNWRRPDASLAVVIVSDEVDCSPNPDFNEIFSTNSVFWEPGSTSANSGLCWNAGTRCVGDASDLDCIGENYDIFGQPLTNPGDWPWQAVLHPINRYEATLQAVEDHVQSNQWNAKVSVALFGGYEIDGERSFSKVGDPEFYTTFGIDPGCSSMEETGQTCQANADCNLAAGDTCNERGRCERIFEAIPPVRAHELQELFGPTQGFSICKDDWGADLAQFMLEATGFDN